MIAPSVMRGDNEDARDNGGTDDGEVEDGGRELGEPGFPESFPAGSVAFGFPRSKELGRTHMLLELPWHAS